MAEVALIGVTKRFGNGHGGRRTCRSTSPTASSSCCSGRPAPARPRRCAWSPGSRSPTPARCAIGGRDVTDDRAGRRATSPSCSSSIRSIRICRSSTTSPFRCARRRGACAEAEIRSAGQRDRRAAAHRRTSSTTGRPQLSGGEMQRVAIGRALVRRPADLSDGRAAVLARRQAARRAAARAEAHPGASSARRSSTSPTTRSRP